jgi:hypothetical protein
MLLPGGPEAHEARLESFQQFSYRNRRNGDRVVSGGDRGSPHTLAANEAPRWRAVAGNELIEHAYRCTAKRRRERSSAAR